jgi:hypothetical protein
VWFGGRCAGGVACSGAAVHRAVAARSLSVGPIGHDAESWRVGQIQSVSAEGEVM